MNIMFALFVLLSGFSLGVSLFSIPVRYILWQKTHRRHHVWHMVLMGGAGLLIGLFLFLVIPNTEAHNIPPSATAWTYLVALAFIGVGAMGLAAHAIRLLLDTEEHQTSV